MALGWAGCASYPEQQLKLAQAAMEEAKKLQAEAFASANWEDAKKAWDEAQGQLSQQKYGLAATTLARAKSRFDKASDIAKAKRQDVLEELKRSQIGINVNYTNLRTSMATARMSSTLKTTMEEGCRQIDQLVERLTTEIYQEDYVKAQSTAKEALRQVQDAQLKLQPAAKKRT
jgi:DNA repair ATPase RecN